MQAINQILYLAKRDLKLRYSGAVLGILWSFIHPLVMIGVYTIIFSKVMHSRLSFSSSPFSYSLYLCSGLLPWAFFSETMQKCTTCFVDQASFIKKIDIHPWVFVGAAVVSCAVNFMIAFGLFSVFLFFIHPPTIVEYCIYLLCVMGFGLTAAGMGLGLGCLNVLVRDVQQLVGLVFSLWFWFTPIVYLTETLPEVAKTLLLFNPAYPFMVLFHDFLFFEKLPEIKIYFLCGFWLLFAAFFGAFFYRRMIRLVRDHL